MSHVPPAAVAKAAQQGLDLRASLPRSKRGGTAVGLARARDLARRRPVSDATLARMRSYFARHAVDAAAPGWGVNSRGWQAWLLWGGDAGRAWAESFRQRNPAGGQMNGTKQDADHFRQGYRFAVCRGIKRHCYCKDRATAAAEANSCGGWAAEMRAADGKVTLTRLGGAKAPKAPKKPAANPRKRKPSTAYQTLDSKWTLLTYDALAAQQAGDLATADAKSAEADAVVQEMQTAAANDQERMWAKLRVSDQKVFRKQLEGARSKNPKKPAKPRKK